MKINPNINPTNSNIVNNTKTKDVVRNTSVENTPSVIQTTNNIGVYILSKLENINTLDNIQKILFLKEMLNLPNEWKDLLIFAALKSYPNTNSEQLLSKLIDLNLLKKNINQTSNEIFNKLQTTHPADDGKVFRNSANDGNSAKISSIIRDKNTRLYQRFNDHVPSLPSAERRFQADVPKQK